jgi:hypothetical protein
MAFNAADADECITCSCRDPGLMTVICDEEFWLASQVKLAPDTLATVITVVLDG